jgi:hypothetical protein
MMVSGALHRIDGPVVSTTLTDCSQLSLFPQASTAVQVRTSSLSAGQSPGLLTSANATVVLG